MGGCHIFESVDDMMDTCEENSEIVERLVVKTDLEGNVTDPLIATSASPELSIRKTDNDLTEKSTLPGYCQVLKIRGKTIRIVLTTYGNLICL